MNNTSLKEKTVFKRVSAIVEDLIAHNTVYQERLDKEQIINYIYHLFNQPNTVPAIDIMAQDDLINRINGILVLHSVAGTLNDFTPEEMAIFDEAIKRK
jgi:hypothetical protein